jgi:hypothetical protein
MPDEIVFSKLKIKQTPVDLADSELEDREYVFKLTEIDCDPPPGSTAEYVKPSELPVVVLSRFLQQEERTRLNAIGFAANPAAFANSDSVGVILGQLGVAKLDISWAYDTYDYKSHRKAERCYRVILYLRGLYDVVEIRVTANEDLTVGGTAFPRGDEIATFQIAVPRKFRIEARYRWNPECCPERPERGPEDFIGEWLPLDWSLGLEWKYQNDLWPTLEGKYRLERSW